MLKLIVNRETTDYTNKIDGKVAEMASKLSDNINYGFTNKVDYTMIDMLVDLKEIYIYKCYGAEQLCGYSMNEIKFLIDTLTNKKC